MNDYKPLVSIVTPSFNQGQFIEETIKSVINQKYRNIEYIIIDGGSTDQTKEILLKYDNKISKVVVEPDDGQSDAINKGFKMAKGELVGWLNSDDIMHENCVEEIVNLYKQNKNAVIIYGSLLDNIDKDSKLIRKGICKYIIPNKNYLLTKNYFIIQMGSFYNAGILKKINYLDKSIYYCMDLDLWLRLLDYGEIISFNDYALASVRDWEGTKTSNGREKFIKDIFITLRKNGGPIFSKNIIRLCYCYAIIKVKRLIGVVKC